MKVQTFIFDRYTFDTDTGVADFYYKTDSGHEFHERLAFEGLESGDYSLTALEQSLQLYWLLAGSSYYKAHLAPTIDFNSHQIDNWQAEALNTIYTKGFGEFFYVNELSPDAGANFFGFSDSREVAVPKTVTLPTELALIGGGKDSLTTVSVMDQLSLPFATYRVNPTTWVTSQLQAIGVPSLIARRTIDPFLTSEAPQYKGHVPITATITASAVVAAVLSGMSSVVLSNEASAEEPNVVNYQGMDINHQWSKTQELETLLQEWIRRYISQDLECYSYLRHMDELEVAEVFSKLAFPQYQGLWSSSNENFKVDATGDLLKTLTSSKTVSTFALLAPHIPREELIAEFGGNPFELPENHELWQQLRGASGVKPFECLATSQEIQTSLEKAYNTGQWPEIEPLLK